MQVVVQMSFVLQLNYLYLRKCVESAPVTSMQQEWFDNILSMIPAELKKQKGFNAYKKALFAEIEVNFVKSMKKSMGRQTECHTG